MTKTILHIVNQSPFENFALQNCLARYQQGDSLLFIENGVYSALASAPISLAGIDCYAIKSDVDGRGIANQALQANIELIDYERFVALSIRHELTQSWY